jgi:hypothetical protein
MSTLWWVVIAVVVAAVVLAVVGWWAVVQRRRSGLRERFGPEYDRTVETADSRRQAEAELREREEHRASLQIVDLSPAARERYTDKWQQIQAEFVDNPALAVSAADTLVQAVLRERGYPIDDFEQRAADISVDHPEVVGHYRRGHELAQSSTTGDSGTESLRQAMTHYRMLFDRLVGDGDDSTEETADDRRVATG